MYLMKIKKNQKQTIKNKKKLPRIREIILKAAMMVCERKF